MATLTLHVGRTMDVPMAFTLAGAKVASVAGGTLTMADAAIATASLMPDGSMAKFTGVSVGSTTASYANTSGGDVLTGTLTLSVIAAPAADVATFDVTNAVEEPAPAPVAAAPAPAAPAAPVTPPPAA